MTPLNWWTWTATLLAALGQPGLIVVIYNALLSRMRESTVKKALALAALPGGWVAAAVIAAGGVLGRAPRWFLYEGGGMGDAVLSWYLFASAVGGLAVVIFIATNPRRHVRPTAERSRQRRIVHVARTRPWPYSAVKRAILSLAKPVNQLTEIEVTRREVELPNLPRAFDGFRIVQVTDFHIDHALEDAFFRKAIELANEEAGDVIALTGDFVSREPHIERIGELLGGLTAREGVYYVRGNHDYWTDPEGVRAELDRLGYVGLGNRSKVIRRGDDAIALVGVEHPYEKVSRWGELFGADLPACRIALIHTPDVVGEVARAGCDLALAGHTHGGQVQFPVVGVTLAPSSFGRRYATGWSVVGRTLLYTNRGLGAFFPVRMLCRPEIAVFVLRCR